MLSFASFGQTFKVNTTPSAIYDSNTAPFTKIAVLNRGESVQLIEKASEAVYKVKYKDKTGFIGRDNLVVADKFVEDPRNAWHSAPLRKDNQIMVTTLLPVKDAYKAIHQHLIENNYNIEKADESTLYITATSALTKGLASGHYRLNIYLKAEDSTRAYLQGTYDASIGGITMSRAEATGVIERLGMKGSTMDNAFSALNTVAQSVTGSKIQYRQRPKP